jgi:hypothetical protein
VWCIAQAAKPFCGAPVAANASLRAQLVVQQRPDACNQGRNCSRRHCCGQLPAGGVDLAIWPDVEERQRLVSRKDKQLPGSRALPIYTCLLRINMPTEVENLPLCTPTCSQNGSQSSSATAVPTLQTRW